LVSLKSNLKLGLRILMSASSQKSSEYLKQHVQNDFTSSTEWYRSKVIVTIYVLG